MRLDGTRPLVGIVGESTAKAADAAGLPVLLDASPAAAVMYKCTCAHEVLEGDDFRSVIVPQSTVGGPCAVMQCRERLARREGWNFPIYFPNAPLRPLLRPQLRPGT